MKITEEVCRYAAELGVAVEEVLRRGMGEGWKEFVEKTASFTWEGRAC
jgi:hypothetical protein